MTCSCEFQCATRAEMEERHGTPTQFAVDIALAFETGELSREEADAAVRRYQREWSESE